MIFFLFFPLHTYRCTSAREYYRHASRVDGGLLSVMLCCLYQGAEAFVDLSLLHCTARVLHSAVSLAHQYATSACVRLRPRLLWGMVTWGGPSKQETCEEGEDEGRKEGSKSLSVQWLGYWRRLCQHFPQRVAEKQGGRRRWSFDVYCMLFGVCARVSAREGGSRRESSLITLIISSNYLQTANEFLRNLIMLCMCSHHHPFCMAAINLLINKYN